MCLEFKQDFPPVQARNRRPWYNRFSDTNGEYCVAYVTAHRILGKRLTGGKTRKLQNVGKECLRELCGILVPESGKNFSPKRQDLEDLDVDGVDSLKNLRLFRLDCLFTSWVGKF